MIDSSLSTFSYTQNYISITQFILKHFPLNIKHFRFHSLVIFNNGFPVFDIFKVGGGEKAAGEMGIPFLGRIPLEPKMVDSGDSGKPYLLEGEESRAVRSLEAIVDAILTRAPGGSEEESGGGKKAMNE